MDKMVESFIQLIRDALENVGDEYYKLTTTYRTLGVVRERIFCYELYHQMRLIQSTRGLTDIQIHGEIDKSGHVGFVRNARKNPDFVFHVPGMMEGNAIVVEVKGKLEGTYQDGICKDIGTLSKFTDNRYYYRLGVLIIYNYNLEEFRKKMGQFFKEELQKKQIATDKIVILCKKSKSVTLEIRKLDDLLKEVK